MNERKSQSVIIVLITFVLLTQLAILLLLRGRSIVLPPVSSSPSPIATEPQLLIQNAPTWTPTMILAGPQSAAGGVVVVAPLPGELILRETIRDGTFDPNVPGSVWLAAGRPYKLTGERFGEYCRAEFPPNGLVWVPCRSVIQQAYTPSPSVTLVPTLPPTLGPPPIQAEMFESEYSHHMKLAHANTIRVTLRYQAPGQKMVPSIEVPGQSSDLATPIAIGTPGPLGLSMGTGYQLLIAARLDAPGFEVQPTAEQEFRLIEGATIPWVWTVRPLGSGDQAIHVTVVARWKPFPEGQGSAIEYPIYRQRYVIAVDVPIVAFEKPIDLTTAITALFGIIFGWLGTTYVFPLISRFTRPPSTGDNSPLLEQQRKDQLGE